MNDEHIEWRQERVASGIAELRKEVGEEGVALRLIYLREIIADAESDLSLYEKQYAESVERGEPFMERYGLSLITQRIGRVLKRAHGEIKGLTEMATGQITDDMIQQAKDYPIENIVEVKKGKALCVFHDDHNPSMGIKNNRYRCFSCGASGSVIDLIRKIQGLDFKEAVKYLSGGG